MNGTEILERTRAAYARLASYQDQGEVVSLFTYASGSRHHAPHHMPFSTWFVRPHNFRFDFAQRIGHPNFQKTCSVWQRNGKPHAHGWWTNGASVAGCERTDGLSNMLLYAGMHSNNAAARVPRLLMPELPLPEPLKARPQPSVRLLHEQDAAGVRCYAIELRWTNPHGTFGESWWVGVDDSLVRKVVQILDVSPDKTAPLREKIKADTVNRHAEGKISDKELMAALESFKPENSPARCENTTSYVTTPNAPIPDDAFDFHPDA